MPENKYKHIFLDGPTYSRRFTSPPRVGSRIRISNKDRFQHSDLLSQNFNKAWNDNEEKEINNGIKRDGVYFDFKGEPDCDLIISSLEAIGSGIRLLNVRNMEIQYNGKQEKQVIATVYIPHNKKSFFLKKISDYRERETKSGKPKNQRLIDSIFDIQASVLKSFWQDDLSLLPDNSNAKWVEVWLNNDDNAIGSFDMLVEKLDIDQAEGFLEFPERIVRLIYVTGSQLLKLVEFSDDIAELRAANKIVLEVENRDQVRITKNIIERIDFNNESNISVCILDTGINNGHKLLRGVLDNNNLHTTDPSWGVNDDNGHGTKMAGVAVYGDLLNVLQSNNRIQINHCLESVKIIPPPPNKNKEKLWGYMTAQGISRAEIQAPNRKRIICMAITSTDTRDRGRPSSWSAMIDNLTSGHEDGTKRLIVVSAGNADADETSWNSYPSSNLSDSIHDPAQSWNALTVGAFTQKTSIMVNCSRLSII